ncbi:hypothetical protein JCM31598_01510 [Desulfonatronum parangueonense]
MHRHKHGPAENNPGGDGQSGKRKNSVHAPVVKSPDKPGARQNEGGWQQRDKQCRKEDIG